MTKLKALAKSVVQTSLKQGASDAAVSVGRKRFIELKQRDGKLERVRESSSSSLTLSVYAEGRYSQHSTSDLRPDALAKFVEQAIAVTRFLEPDEYRRLLDPKYYAGRRTEPLDIRDSSYESIDTDKRTDLVRAVEAGAKSPKGPIISVNAQYQDELSERVQVHSNGFEDSETSTGFWTGAVTSVDDDGKKPEDWYFIGGRFLSDLQDPEAVGAEASRRALDRRGQKKLASGTMNVIVEARTAGRLLSYFLRAMRGSELQQQRSFLVDQQGKRVGSELFTLIDDPHLPRGMASARYDADGMSLKKRTLVKGGELQGYLIGNYYARKLGVAPTGGTPTNVIMPPGQKTLEQLCSDLGSGVLLTGLLGGNADPTTGDFSHGFAGYEIRDGKLGDPVGEMNITGSHKTLWSKLAMAGNDPFVYSRWRLPSLVFEGVSVSGA
ncbi:MAG: TldD/PmbA family protein [Myxococcota bacterium]